MYNLKLTKQQLDNLMKCLDITLRNGGLASLSGVAELYHTLQGAEEEVNSDSKQTSLPFHHSER